MVNRRAISIPTDEAELRERVGEEVRLLDDRWMWLRDRIGDAEWERVVRRRRMWLALVKVRLRFLVFTMILGGCCGLAIVLNVALGRSLTRDIQYLPALVGPIFFLVATVGLSAVTYMMRRDITRLMLLGHSPRAIEDALWADHNARALEDALPDIIYTRRLREALAAAPPWWRTEMKGTHLIIWISLALAIYGLVLPHRLPDELHDAAVLAAMVGWIAKLSYWAIWRMVPARTRLGMCRFYRWCGTRLGTATTMVGTPCILIGLGTMIIWMLQLFGLKT
jgi:hypothetical protein